MPPPGAREFFWRGDSVLEGREHGLSASVRIQGNLKMSAIEDKMLVIVPAIIIILLYKLVAKGASRFVTRQKRAECF